MVYFAIAGTILVVILLAFYIYKKSSGYHVVKYDFHDKRIKKDKVSIVFISDLHNKQYGNKNELILKEIENINPDFVILGGDMITTCMEKWTDYSDTLDFISNLNTKFPVYYGIGNHEERLKRRPEKFPKGEYERLTGRLENMGVPLLSDEKIVLDDYGINIYSLNIEHEFYRRFVTKKLPETYISEHVGEIDKDKYNILVAHNPEHFKNYAAWGADLTLSGHVHGGVIRLPLLGGVVSPAVKLFPKYDGGKFNIGPNCMILSRGLGTHTIPIRINNKAEIIEIKIWQSQ